MPRSNRRRHDPGDDASFERLLAGWKRTEVRRGVEWTVQPVSAAQAQKPYTCPGCGGQIDVGVAHLALLVTDIHERHQRMAALGVSFRNPPVEITAGANKGGWACYLHDPDGITLELLQFSDQRALDLGLQNTAKG